jgi:hypothetical protein
VIDDLYQQAVHFFNNLLLTNYETGDWSSPPTFPNSGVCLVNCPSFTALTTQRRAELDGGYIAAWMCGASGERVTAQEWIGRIGRSGAFRIGPNRFWQLMAWAVNPLVDTSTAATLVDVHDVQDETGDPIIDYERLWNVIPYSYGPPLDEGTDWVGSKTVTDDFSIADYRRKYTADALELYCLRSPTVAAHSAAQHLMFSRLAPVYIEPEGDLRLSRFDHGSIFKYSHFRGFGASGYVERVFAVVGVTFIPMARRVRLQAVDITPFLPVTVIAYEASDPVSVRNTESGMIPDLVEASDGGVAVAVSEVAVEPPECIAGTAPSAVGSSEVPVIVVAVVGAETIVTQTSENETAEAV